MRSVLDNHRAFFGRTIKTYSAKNRSKDYRSVFWPVSKITIFLNSEIRIFPSGIVMASYRIFPWTVWWNSLRTRNRTSGQYRRWTFLDPAEVLGHEPVLTGWYRLRCSCRLWTWLSCWVGICSGTCCLQAFQSSGWRGRFWRIWNCWDIKYTKFCCKNKKLSIELSSVFDLLINNQYFNNGGNDEARVLLGRF